MRGYQLVFVTQQGRTHGMLNMAEWVLAEARAIGIRGATMSTAQGGYGRDGVYRSARFFEVGEQPVEVVMAAGEEECERLFRRIEEEGLQIFYIKTPVEFGITGSGD